MSGTYPDYLLLRKSEAPPPDTHESDVRVYVDTDGVLHTLQPDGTDASLGGSNPASALSQVPAPADWEIIAQDMSAWTASGGASSDLADTADYDVAGQSAQIVTDGAGTAARLQTTALTAVDLTDKYLRVRLKISDASLLANLKLYLGSGGGFANTFNFTIQQSSSDPDSLMVQSDEWIALTLPWGEATQTGSPDRTAINAIRFEVTDTATGTGLTARLNEVAVALVSSRAFPNGVVSFTFDDVYDDALTEAAAYLDKYGWAASCFPIVQRVGTAGFLTEDQLRLLQDRHGWDVGLHANTSAVHDAGFVATPIATVEAEIVANKAWLVENDLGKTADLLAYPKDDYSYAVKQMLSRYVSAARGVVTPTHETFPPSDPMVLRSRSLNDITTLAAAKTLVDNAAANKSWQIFVGHQLVASPSGSIQWAISDFQALVDYCATKDVTVLPLSHVLKERRRERIVIRPHQPRESGIVAWNYDPAVAANSSAPAAGRLIVCRVPISQTCVVSNILLYVSTAGATLTTNENFAGLFDASGAQLGVTADQTTAWASTGLKTMAITPVTIEGGDDQHVYVAFLANGTTRPAFRRNCGDNALANVGATGDNIRFGAYGSDGQTAMPASITPSLLFAQESYWCGLS